MNICAVGNAIQFGPTVLKCTMGVVPKDIFGNYFRNGPGIMNYDKQILQHWFEGDGYILKLSFNKGQCTAQSKFVDTIAYQRRKSTKIFKQGVFQKLWNNFWKSDNNQSVNTGNTSVLCLKNSPNFLALCQAGDPYVLKKQNLDCVGFQNYGWIKGAFSAHPKVDPDNGDIFNIGMALPNVNIMRATKDMKRICQTRFKLREFQSIHDFVLAGDYLVIFQAPIRFSMKDMLWGNKFFFDCKSFDQNLPTLAHIYTKEELKHVKTINIDPFYVFHFTNGFSNKQKIVIEYIKYDIQSSRQLFKLLHDVPKFIDPQFKHSDYKGKSVLQQLTISLQDFTTKARSVQINGEFPVCEDQEVGKEWRYTYAVGSLTQELLKFNTLFKYDRHKQILHKTTLEGNVHFNEPAIIRTQENLYLLCVINKDRKSFVHIFDAQTLKTICQLEIPQFIPGGFHGKWDIVN